MSKFPWKVIVLFLLLSSALALSIGGGTAQARPAQQEAPKLNTTVVTGTVVMPGRAIVNAAATTGWLIHPARLLARIKR